MMTMGLKGAITMVLCLRTAAAIIVALVVAAPVAAQSHQGPLRQEPSGEGMSRDETARYDVMPSSLRAPLAAESGGAVRRAYATNARVPLAPDGFEVAAMQRAADTSPGPASHDPAPGFGARQ